jgi:hypothetical protein
LSDLTLFAVDTLANPLVPQANETEKQTLDTCGLQCTTPFADYDPDTHSWKTYGVICLWGLETYSQTWPKSGMTQNGKSYQQPPLVRRTKETGYLLWPTPTACDWKGRGNCTEQSTTRFARGYENKNANTKSNGFSNVGNDYPGNGTQPQTAEHKLRDNSGAQNVAYTNSAPITTPTGLASSKRTQL